MEGKGSSGERTRWSVGLGPQLPEVVRVAPCAGGLPVMLEEGQRGGEAWTGAAWTGAAWTGAAWTGLWA